MGGQGFMGRGVLRWLDGSGQVVDTIFTGNTYTVDNANINDVDWLGVYSGPLQPAAAAAKLVANGDAPAATTSQPESTVPAMFTSSYPIGQQSAAVESLQLKISALAGTVLEVSWRRADGSQWIGQLDWRTKLLQRGTYKFGRVNKFNDVECTGEFRWSSTGELYSMEGTFIDANGKEKKGTADMCQAAVDERKYKGLREARDRLPVNHRTIVIPDDTDRERKYFGGRSFVNRNRYWVNLMDALKQFISKEEWEQIVAQQDRSYVTCASDCCITLLLLGSGGLIGLVGWRELQQRKNARKHRAVVMEEWNRQHPNANYPLELNDLETCCCCFPINSHLNNLRIVLKQPPAQQTM